MRPCKGPNHPDTAACRNQLAVAYRLAGRTAEAGRLFDRNPNSPAHAAALAVRGSTLLLREEARRGRAEAARVPDHPREDPARRLDRPSTPSRARRGALDQRKYAEAEPLLLSGYEGMKQREDTIPPQDKPRLTRALERLVRLYEAWGKQDEAIEVAEGTRGGDAEKPSTIPAAPRPHRHRGFLQIAARKSRYRP